MRKGTLPATLREAIAREVEEANGRKRTRTLDNGTVERMVLAAIAEATPGSTSVQYVHGGHVANAYKYPAYATAALVLTRGDIVGVLVTEVSARKGSTGVGPIASWATSEIPPGPEWLWIRLTR